MKKKLHTTQRRMMRMIRQTKSNTGGCPAVAESVDDAADCELLNPDSEPVDDEESSHDAGNTSKQTNKHSNQGFFHDALILSAAHLPQMQAHSFKVARDLSRSALGELLLHGASFFSPNREGATARALWPSGQVSALCTES